MPTQKAPPPRPSADIIRDLQGSAEMLENIGWPNYARVMREAAKRLENTSTVDPSPITHWDALKLRDVIADGSIDGLV